MNFTYQPFDYAEERSAQGLRVKMIILNIYSSKILVCDFFVIQATSNDFVARDFTNFPKNKKLSTLSGSFFGFRFGIANLSDYQEG